MSSPVNICPARRQIFNVEYGHPPEFRGSVATDALRYSLSTSYGPAYEKDFMSQTRPLIITKITGNKKIVFITLINDFLDKLTTGAPRINATTAKGMVATKPYVPKESDKMRISSKMDNGELLQDESVQFRIAPKIAPIKSKARGLNAIATQKTKSFPIFPTKDFVASALSAEAISR